MILTEFCRNTSYNRGELRSRAHASDPQGPGRQAIEDVTRGYTRSGHLAIVRAPLGIFLDSRVVLTETGQQPSPETETS